MDNSYLEYVEIGTICVAIIVTIIALVVSYKYTLKSMKMGKGFRYKVPSKNTSTSPTENDDQADDAFDHEPPMDPLEFCEHIHGEVKRVQNKVTTRKIEEKMTAEQIQEERNTQRKQLEAIFNLMKDQTDKFGVDSMAEVKQQMKLYG